MRCLLLCVTITCLAGAVHVLVSAQDDPCVCLEQFGTEALLTPLIFETAPGDDERIFVGEQMGFIWVYDRDGARNPEPFLNITHLFQGIGVVHFRGLLALAFHPDYQNNRKLYVGYSVTESVTAYLVEYKTAVDNPDIADMDSERVIMEIDRPDLAYMAILHALFDIDGLLLLTVSDSLLTEVLEGQNMSTYSGKLLRIDVDTGDDDIPYLVPEDNPFVNETGYLPEIYALGLRMAYRCTVDGGDPESGEGRGRVFCPDVGQADCEEVNIVQPGGNYAWPVKECIYCYPPDPDLVDCTDVPVSPGEEVFAIYMYSTWSDTSEAVIGGHVYRGSDLPSYNGDYIHADWMVKWHDGVSRLRENEDGSWSNAEMPLCDASVCGDELTSEHGNYIFAFGQDQDYELYLLVSDDWSEIEPTGVIYKLVDPQSKTRGMRPGTE